MHQELSVHLQEQIEILKASSQVVLQRHGKSIANESYEEIKDHGNPEELAAWLLNPSLRDPRLCQTGHEQCAEAQLLVNALKIHTVFVSPLRRTLETAYNTYKNHPNFEKIRFVVLPLIRESLNTSSDVPSSIEKIIEEFREILPNLDVSAFDEYFDKTHYFIEDLQPDLKDRMIANLKAKSDDELGSNAFDLFVKETKKIYPFGRLESKWNVYDRSVKAKKFIKRYIEENQIPPTYKVVILSHFIYFYMHTGKWAWKCSRESDLAYPSEYIRMKN